MLGVLMAISAQLGGGMCSFSDVVWEGRRGVRSLWRSDGFGVMERRLFVCLYVFFYPALFVDLCLI